VRKYLLEKWGQNVPLEIDHIHPKSRGKPDRVSHLTLACRPCNQRKNNRDAAAFLAHDPKRLARIEMQRKAPLKNTAAVNSTRWALCSSEALPCMLREVLKCHKTYCLATAASCSAAIAMGIIGSLKQFLPQLSSQIAWRRFL
jgi:hypothetical protein